MRNLFIVAALSLAAHAAAAQQQIPAYRLREEWRIVSNESSRDMLLTAVSGLSALPDGRLVTSHGGEGLLRVFDSTGKFLRTVGRRGQGPGEFTEPHGIGYVGDTIWVRDGPATRRFLLFNSAFAPIGQAVLPQAAIGRIDYGLVPGGLTFATLFYGSPRAGAERDSTIHAFIDVSGKVVARAPIEVKTARQRFQVRLDGEPLTVSAPFSVSTQTALAPGGREAAVLESFELWGGTPGQIAIRRLTPDGRLSQPVVASLPAIPLTREAADRAITSIVSKFPGSEDVIRREWTQPRFLPAFSSFDYFGDGLLWLRDGSDPNIRTVVSIDGRPQMRVTIPEGVTVWRANRTKVWATHRDSSDLPIIVRYRLEPVAR